MNKEDLKTVLNYSKSELKQADQKLSYILTANSLILSGLITSLIFSINNNTFDNIWMYCLTFGIPMVLQTCSIFVILLGIWPVFSKSKSNFNFNSIELKGILETNIIKDMENTIKINCFLTKKKYKRARWAICFTLPLVPLLVYIKNLKKK